MSFNAENTSDGNKINNSNNSIEYENEMQCKINIINVTKKLSLLLYFKTCYI